MLTKDFLNLINKTLTPSEFSKTIDEEVLNYKRLKSKKGASLPIYGDSKLKIFTKNHLINLLEYYLANDLTEIQLEYILNWLDVQDIEYDDRVEKVLFSLSLPEINFPITRENVESSIDYLKELNAKLILK
jgi:hypothetical protein